MFEVMACARPILLGVEGEARRLAEQEARAAIYVEPENAEALVAGILYLQQHPDEARLLGLRGRAYVEAHYDRDQLTAELDVHIAKLLTSKGRKIASAPMQDHTADTINQPLRDDQHEAVEEEKQAMSVPADDSVGSNISKEG
jgi:hypothetical protein